MQKRFYLTAALFAACPLVVSAQDANPAAAPAPVASPTVTPGPGTGSAVTLRFKFSPGQTLYYQMTTDTDGVVQSPQLPTPMPIKNHIVMLLHQTVKDVRASDGAATMESGLDSMTFSMNGQTFPMPKDKMAQMKNIGTTLILPNGKVLSFTPNPALAGATAMPGMDMSHSNALSSLGQLPDVPLKAGDSWKSAVAMGMLGTQIASGFALTSVDVTDGKTIATVGQTIDGTFNTATANAAAASSPLGAMTMQGKVNGTGTLRFDTDAGALEGATSNLTMAMTMTPKGATQGMQMQMKVATSMKRAAAPAPASAATVQ